MVVRHDSERMLVLMAQQQGNNRHVLDDFSVVSVVASALTAATSFLLSSKIGLAGSLIGAVIAAVISAVATQVYKGILETSAERIREATIVDDSMHMGEQYRPAHTSTNEGSSIVRKLVAFAVVVALVAVAIVAATIGFATHGEGIGPTSFVSTAEQTDVEEEVSPEPDNQAGSESNEETAQPESAETEEQASTEKPQDTQDDASATTDASSVEEQSSSAATSDETQTVSVESSAEGSQQ